MAHFRESCTFGASVLLHLDQIAQVIIRILGHSSGLGKGSPTTSRGQDQDFSAEVPLWLVNSSWKPFYVEDQSCSGTHSSHFCSLISPSIPTYKQTEDLKVS